MSLSSAGITRLIVVSMVMSGSGMSLAGQQTAGTSTGIAARRAVTGDPAQIFQRGQDALNRGELDEAERDFRQVLEVDGQSGVAFANLGVVYMRRKQWVKALAELKKAEK